jgi:ligand-binding sensor domain-containing protein
VGSGAVAQDSAGRIWLAAGAGVSCCAVGQWRAIGAPSGLPFVGVGRLTQAPDGKLWAIEEYGGAVATIDPASLAIEPFDLPDVRIRAIASTPDTVWIGSQEGLIRRRGGAQLRITTADGLPSDAIRALLATDTTLWIGTDKGLASYDLTSEQVAGAVEAFDGGIVDDLLDAPDGSVWAGLHSEGDTRFGVIGRFDGNEWRIWNQGDQPLPEGSSGVTALNVDAQGHIWVTVWGGGLHTWDGAAWKSWNQADGALWLATNDGLLRLSKEGVAALR